MTQTEVTPTASLTGKWKSYPAYKDSGVEWLGEIPAHWEVKRIAMVAKKITNGYVGPTRDIFVDDGIRYLQSLHIKHGEIRFDRPYYVTEEWSNAHAKSILQKGDVLVVQTGDIGQCCAVPNEFTGCNCHALIIVQLRQEFGSGFYLSAFLRSDYGRNTLLCAQTGALHPHLECGKLREIKVLLPPPEEQNEIISFLDRETTRINTLIAKKEQLIELLQEKRAALISHAVTKGLDPTVAMKDSGVEWMGEIPKHWEVKRLKFAASFYGGGTPYKENLEYWSGDIPWVSPKDMKAEIINDTEDHISKVAIENSSTRLIEPGAVLVVVRSGILRHSIPVAINIRPVALNQDMKAIVAKSFLMPEYLASVIRGHQDALLVEWRKEGATVESIEFELLVNTICSIPPLTEQQAIIAYLKYETANIDALISKIREGVEKLKEYSTALISAAVTGKIDVRGEILSTNNADF